MEDLELANTVILQNFTFRPYFAQHKYVLLWKLKHVKLLEIEMMTKMLIT